MIILDNNKCWEMIDKMAAEIYKLLPNNPQEECITIGDYLGSYSYQSEIYHYEGITFTTEDLLSYVECYYLEKCNLDEEFLGWAIKNCLIELVRDFNNKR